MIDPARLRAAYQTARRDLLAEREAAGHWIGRLSTSALSTATAASALSLVSRRAKDSPYPRDRLEAMAAGGVEWLAGHQNPDGGWGDTDKSVSNIATAMLVRAAFHLAGVAEKHGDMLGRAECYIEAQGGVPGLRRRYGKDKTFAVPILTNCALAGLVPWCEAAPLPFELACMPRGLLGLLRLPVVSYAIPALVAIGQARYFHAKPWNPITRLVRRLSINKSLAVLQRMQPESGGYLEATPLTSFVVMSLASIGQADHPVVRRGVEFLVNSARGDGSWPIDTNLATWVTTLSINALAGARDDVSQLGCLDWLLSCQHVKVHPFTSAAPGGWAWTDLSGGVPDADDTAGALLALASMRRHSSDKGRFDGPAAEGIRWLHQLQNRDGGWPTFCRGWGALPFDRSGVDLTAHVMRALAAWHFEEPGLVENRDSLEEMEVVPLTYGDSTKAICRGLQFLASHQRPDGSWVPLWFGNQFDPAEENPVYGTARVLLAYRDLNMMATEPAQRGVEWLVKNQAVDGGWGGSTARNGGGRDEVSSVEETAVAVDALLVRGGDPSVQAAVEQGLAWLVKRIEAGRHRETSPIGLYFAKLWYYERLYPLIFTVAALGRAVCRPAASHPPSIPAG